MEEGERGQEVIVIKAEPEKIDGLKDGWKDKGQRKGGKGMRKAVGEF